jgi:single-strand DNA-binding protein
VVMRGRLSEIAEEFLSKGKQVAVEGKLVHRSYENKENEKRFVTEIHAYEMKLL